MKISEALRRPPALLKMLADVWERSIRSSHHFLTEKDIINIKLSLLPALQAVPLLFIAHDSKLYGFMGIKEDKLEMLFVYPPGNGIGSQLLTYAHKNFNIQTLDVNAENTKALQFYQKMGYRQYAYSALDDQGRTFPLVRMRRIANK